MDFYESIAEYYDYIFPLDDGQVEFVRTSIPQPHPGKEVLDIGCGTGSLAVALAGHGFRVTGIDLDSAMVERAQSKGRNEASLSFLQMDMRELSGRFAPSSFDAVLCLGNTLVHLDTGEDVLSVLGASRDLLRTGGRLLLQILNYDYILDRQTPGLPTIENEQVRFERFYRYDGKDGPISFRTVLTVKTAGLVVENEIILHPLRRHQLDAMLRQAGFREISFYGTFRRGPLLPESLPLVVEAL